jgi:hypothetical protein
MGERQLGIVNFLKLCELIGEKEALGFLKAAENGFVSVESIEKLIYTDEAKEQYVKRLRDKME